MKWTREALIQQYVEGTLSKESRKAFDRSFRDDPIFTDGVLVSLGSGITPPSDDFVDRTALKLDKRITPVWKRYKPSGGSKTETLFTWDFISILCVMGLAVVGVLYFSIDRPYRRGPDSPKTILLRETAPPPRSTLRHRSVGKRSDVKTKTSGTRVDFPPLPATMKPNRAHSVPVEAQRRAMGFFKEGMKLEKIGQKDAAGDSYLKAVQTDPNLEQAWIRLSRIHYEKAVLECRKALEANPGNAELKAWLDKLLSVR